MIPTNESPGRVGARTGAEDCVRHRDSSIAQALEGQPLDLSPSLVVPRRSAPFAGEIERALTGWWSPNAKIFAGALAWERAQAMRRAFGPLAALVLPDDEDPEELRWPALQTVVVHYPDGSPAAYRRKLSLARALIRDGVGRAWIEHWPSPMDVQCAEARP